MDPAGRSTAKASGGFVPASTNAEASSTSTPSSVVTDSPSSDASPGWTNGMRWPGIRE